MLLGLPPLAAANPAFSQTEIDTGLGQHQRLIPGFFTDGATADLAVITINRSGRRMLQLYSHQGRGWSEKNEYPLPEELLFVDSAPIGGRDRLLFYTSGQLNWFDPSSGSIRKLVSLPFSFTPLPEVPLPSVDITRDLNLDGLVDLVVPDQEGFWISIQHANESFSQAVKLGPTEPYLDQTPLEGEKRYGDRGLSLLTTPWYLSRVHTMDYNLDGLVDLLFWRRDHFEVHLQGEDGLFSASPISFMPGVPFDADGEYAHEFGFDQQSALSILFGLGGRRQRTVLLGFDDINGDGLPDLITHSLEGRSLLRLKSAYRFHFGAPSETGVRFSPVADTEIRPIGTKTLGYAFHRIQDLDGDGPVDVMIYTVETGIGKMFSALLGSSITVDFEYFHMNEDGFPNTPSLKKTLKTNFDPLYASNGFFFPTVEGGDVSGDGRQDLLVGRGRNELLLFYGRESPELLSEPPQKIDVAIPDRETHIQLFDLNRDGREDILIHHPSETAPNRVIVLIPLG